MERISKKLNILFKRAYFFFKKKGCALFKEGSIRSGLGKIEGGLTIELSLKLTLSLLRVRVLF